MKKVGNLNLLKLLLFGYYIKIVTRSGWILKIRYTSVEYNIIGIPVNKQFKHIMYWREGVRRDYKVWCINDFFLLLVLLPKTL